MSQKIEGKYNHAIVFTDSLDETAARQIKELCDQPFVKGLKIRVMPDAHAGAGSTIGTTMTVKDKIVPNLVGVDIGCGVECAKLEQTSIDFDTLDKVIRRHIPAGFKTRRGNHPYTEKLRIDDLRCKNKANLKMDRAYKSLGTLGGGNHFIEVNQDDEGALYLAVHSGSRHLGFEIARYYQQLGWFTLNESTPEAIDALRERLKAEGRSKEINKAVRQLKKQVLTEVPKDLAYVEGQNFDDYLHDMEIAQEYATLNRRAMIEVILQEMNLTVSEQFTTIHNYIDVDEMVLRKGAVSAKKGEKIIVPINMRDGSLICVGKGNEEWNQSAPHGAGRVLSRTQAKKTLSLDKFKQQMGNVFTTSVHSGTLDEAPMAYKSMDLILEEITDTADVLKVIKPVYNFKAS